MSTRYSQNQIEAAKTEGHDAYYAGKQLQDNPHDPDLEGELHHAWEASWLEAEEEDEPEVNEDEDFLENTE